MSKKKGKTAAPEKPKKTGQQSPLLIEMAFTLSRLLILSVAILMGSISLLAGCPIWVVTLRMGAGLLGMGLLLWAVNWILCKGTVEVVGAQLEQAAENADSYHTAEWKA